MVTINEDVHRFHGNKRICSTTNRTNKIGLSGSDLVRTRDGPTMTLPRCVAPRCDTPVPCHMAEWWFLGLVTG